MSPQDDAGCHTSRVPICTTLDAKTREAFLFNPTIKEFKDSLRKGLPRSGTSSDVYEASRNYAQ